jgi:hypothetical protein
MAERQTPGSMPGRAASYSTPTPAVGVTTSVVTPTDRVRWGPIFAGLFATLTTLAVLALLGIAVGLSSYNAGEPASNFGIGAGIWGIISALIAFAIGGWLASTTAAVRGRGNGLLNGAMVWVVAIPLLLYLLAGGLGTALNAAANAAPAAAQVAATAASNPAVQATAQGAQNSAQDAAQQVTPQNVEQATRTASTGAWGTLIALVLGFLASSIGGIVGARSEDEVRTTT